MHYGVILKKKKCFNFRQKSGQKCLRRNNEHVEKRCSSCSEPVSGPRRVQVFSRMALAFQKVWSRKSYHWSVAQSKAHTRLQVHHQQHLFGSAGCSSQDFLVKGRRFTLWPSVAMPGAGRGGPGMPAACRRAKCTSDFSLQRGWSARPALGNVWNSTLGAPHHPH